MPAYPYRDLNVVHAYHGQSYSFASVRDAELYLEHFLTESSDAEAAQEAAEEFAVDAPETEADPWADLKALDELTTPEAE